MAHDGPLWIPLFSPAVFAAFLGEPLIDYIRSCLHGPSIIVVYLHGFTMDEPQQWGLDRGME